VQKEKDTSTSVERTRPHTTVVPDHYTTDGTVTKEGASIPAPSCRCGASASLASPTSLHLPSHILPPSNAWAAMRLAMMMSMALLRLDACATARRDFLPWRVTPHGHLLEAAALIAFLHWRFSVGPSLSRATLLLLLEAFFLSSTCLSCPARHRRSRLAISNVSRVQSPLACASPLAIVLCQTSLALTRLCAMDVIFECLSASHPTIFYHKTCLGRPAMKSTLAAGGVSLLWIGRAISHSARGVLWARGQLDYN